MRHRARRGGRSLTCVLRGHLAAALDEPRDERGSAQLDQAIAFDPAGSLPAQRPRTCRASKVAAPGLLALDRLEERLEVPVAEAPRAVRWIISKKSVGRSCAGLGEDLEQVALVVAVDEDLCSRSSA